ncbi:MAG: ATP-binding protein [Burkholderiaceae bacterium]|nr:ATP-binding protein [Rhodoferax sp.]MCP5283518.1 ATP-binding protein [Burkholderiaceae bacterium]
MKIAIVGAESTGKSVLATALADALADATGWRVTAVPEWLRLWCEREGRTPRPEEQAAIATETHARIDAAAALHDIVVCDTTALMTTVYSDLLFNDRSLDALAIAHQRSMDLTLLTALDLPWVADGHQRDGPHVRGPVDDHVRALLIDHGLPWALVAGTGPARLQCALDAVAPLLRARDTPRRGLFSRLLDRNAAPEARAWSCEFCDDPDCEHALRTPATR